ncbi:g6021 [Coccomyxa viridis]|uniref:Small ribosomal subunit protein uS5c n=1 Tax=Coccomyxa viridis TaxID=1274662 RepID=A0ABP1FUC1_9CHLO
MMQRCGALPTPLACSHLSSHSTHLLAAKPLSIGVSARRQQRCRAVAVRAAGADFGDAESDETWEDPRGRGRRGRGRGGESGGRGRREGGMDEPKEFQERVVQVSRVTKVVKGGKSMSFRAVVVIGDEKGRVGVGTATAKEVVDAVQKGVADAKKHLITVPLTRSFSFPHKFDGIFGAAKVMLRPASEGTGVIAGGAVRVVLELAGIKNAFGKQLGSGNPLNNARATIEGLRAQRTVQQVAEERGLTVAELMGFKPDTITDVQQAAINQDALDEQAASMVTPATA